MGNFLRLFLSIKGGLLGIFLIALTLIFLKDFILTDIFQPNSSSSKIINLVYLFSFSYLTSFIFYFLVVHLKNLQDRLNIYEYIKNKNKGIIEKTESILRDLKNRSRVSFNSKYPSTEELNKVFLIINLSETSPHLSFNGLSGYFTSWFEYFADHKNDIDEILNKILRYAQYVESDYVKLLLKIEDCNFFDFISYTFGLSVMDKSFKKDVNLTKDLVKYIKKEVIVNYLFEYFSLIKKLELYAKKEFNGGREKNRVKK